MRVSAADLEVGASVCALRSRGYRWDAIVDALGLVGPLHAKRLAVAFLLANASARPSATRSEADCGAVRIQSRR
jgi:hypothetical protein